MTVTTALDRLPHPPCAELLGWHVQDARPADGWIKMGFVGLPTFTNPAGYIQGGLLAAMLDDTMGPALAATLAKGEFAPTLNLNVSFEKAAVVGVITGKGRVSASESERGVLRRRVPLWLGLPELRSLVVGFEEAHIGHGGAGALYVRVRRGR